MYICQSFLQKRLNEKQFQVATNLLKYIFITLEFKKLEKILGTEATKS